MYEINNVESFENSRYDVQGKRGMGKDSGCQVRVLSGGAGETDLE